MLGQVALFTRKDLAAAFLTVEPASHDAVSGEELEKLTPEAALRLVDAKTAALEKWRASLAAVYNDAFNRSGRVVDGDTELQRFTELKRVAQGAVGLNTFLSALLSEQTETPSQPSEAAENLRSLKRERQKEQRENSQLASELAVQYDRLRDSLNDAHIALKDVIETPSLDETLSQRAVQKETLQAAIQHEEGISQDLVAELGALNSEGCSLDEAFQQEHSEITLLKEMIQRQTLDTRSKHERREISRQATEALLHQISQMGSFLVKLGGIEMEGPGMNPLVLKLRTDVQAPDVETGIPQTRCFIHRLKLELHPSTCHITRAQLKPDEGLCLERAIQGQTLTQGLSHVRSLLFLTLHQRVYLESLPEYRFTRVDPENAIWRVALPNQIEIEMMLPDAWPHEQTAELKLLAIQAPRVGFHFDAVLKEIQQQSFTDLKEFLTHITQRTNPI